LIDVLTEYDDCDENDFELHSMLRHRLMDEKNRIRQVKTSCATVPLIYKGSVSEQTEIEENQQGPACDDNN